ncbi:MAG TPA: iron ABC transporter permease [Polyangiaceae bacterium]|nr:iron ABC transporter permease [Polyangiaceae bacterium]
MTALTQAWTELSRSAKARVLLASLVVLLLITFVVALASGVVPVPLGALFRIVSALLSGASLEGVPERVFVAIRLPRALLAVLTGAGLGAAGAAMQGLFRNPLADPGLMGVTAGASLATALMIVVVGGAAQVSSTLGLLLLPCAAFTGALGATFLIWSFAQRAGAVRLTTLLLAGIAVNAVAFAGVGFLTFIASDAQLRELTSWNLGSLNGATWRGVAVSAPFVLLSVLGLPRLARALNALALGEEDASYLGIDVERTKRVVLVLVSLGTGATVAFTGAIGFVGLVVPHLVRLAIGPDHRTLLPGSALLGAIVLTLADTVGRVVAAPSELPVGVVTALLGAPFFLWLLRAARRMGA